MEAMDEHRNHPRTRDAQEKSGLWGPVHERWGRSGLSDKELTVRNERDATRRDIAVARALRREISDRRSCDKWGSCSEEPASKECEHLQWWTHRKWPRSFQQLKRREQNLLTRLENGELEDKHKDAVEQHGGAVCAKPFRVALAWPHPHPSRGDRTASREE